MLGSIKSRVMQEKKKFRFAKAMLRLNLRILPISKDGKLSARTSGDVGDMTENV